MRTFWVEPTRLIAGGYPGLINELESRKHLRRLIRSGVITFIDLTQDGEADLLPYELMLYDEADNLGVKTKYRRFPIRDMGLPTRKQMIEILDSLKTALVAGECVYLHCYGGKGRTGTVIGCYLVDQGYSGDEAINRIAQLRNDPSDGVIRSPETKDQCEMVRSWDHGPE